MKEPTLTLKDRLDLGSVEIVVRGILQQDLFPKDGIEHLQIIRERITKVICSLQEQEEKEI
jgi:hypothetical protein